jgi:hypothetical protein
MYRLMFALLLGFILLGANERVLYENPRDSSGWVFEGSRRVQYAVARSEEEWGSSLAKLEPPPRNVPDVDWASEFPILVYLGEFPTGGYAVQIDEVTAKGRTIVVQVSRQSPPPGAVLTMAFTYPMHMITLSRDHLVGIEKVRFVSREGELLGEVDIF